MRATSYEVVRESSWGPTAATESHNPLLFQAVRSEIRTALIRELGPFRGRWAALWVKNEQIIEAMQRAGIVTVKGRFLDAFLAFIQSDLGQTLIRILLGLIL